MTDAFIYDAVRSPRGKGRPRSAAADRASFAGRSGRAATYDLIDAIKSRRVELEKLKDSELPEELAKLKTVGERKAHLDKIDKRRTELNREAVELDTKRQEFIRQELLKRGKGVRAFHRVRPGQAQPVGLPHASA